MNLGDKITILGFGNQAKAWALNLRDSGINVIIALRESSPSIALVQSLNFQVLNYETKQLTTDTVCLLTPDHTHEEILTVLSINQQKLNIIYAHGFSLESKKLAEKFPQFEHILLAPKAIASEVRFKYETKRALTAFYSLESASNIEFSALLEFSNKLGIKYLHPAKIKEETMADLFSEQSLLCSVLPYSILESFNLLVSKGYPEKLAFFECFYESKLIIDTLIAQGPEAFFKLISPNALIGAQKGNKLLIDSHFKQNLEKLLTEIENKSFFQEVENCDFEQEQKNVISFWKRQHLSKVYKELKETL